MWNFDDEDQSRRKENIGETREGKSKNEDGNTKRIKFKVEMPVFNGEDPDSWLFRADIYFQIHKLTDAEKLLLR